VDISDHKTGCRNACLEPNYIIGDRLFRIGLPETPRDRYGESNGYELPCIRISWYDARRQNDRSNKRPR
jgi:hypothetical protein